MSTLLEKLLSLDEALVAGDIPHAFGGALALAFCIGEPRATVDIDVNVFLPVVAADRLLSALPSAVKWSDDERTILGCDGQVRLWWESTPIDVFLNTSSFHEAAATRSRVEVIDGRALPFLSCRDLAVFKAFFNRRKDWADLEAMLIAGSFDLDATVGALVMFLGPDDERIAQLLEISRSLPGSGNDPRNDR